MNMIYDDTLYDEDIDCESDLFLDEEETEEVLLEKCTQEERATWNSVKVELNEWGTRFSLANKMDKLYAIEKIFKLIDKVSLRYEDPAINPKEYDRAMNTLQVMYPGTLSSPIKYVGKLYPEEDFFRALNEVLGFGVNSKGERLHRIYDHTKGAAFTTHFLNILRYTVSDSQRQRTKELSKVSSYSKTPFNDERSDGITAEPADHSVNVEKKALEDKSRSLSRSGICVFVNLAKITEAVILASKSKKKSPDEKKLSKMKPSHLKLFYTLHLINFTRDTTDAPADRYEEKTIMSVLDKGFTLFSTDIKEEHIHSYTKLEKASFSKLVTENGYTKTVIVKNDAEEYSYKYTILADIACAVYCGVSDSTLSDRFKSLRQNLLPYLKPKTK